MARIQGNGQNGALTTQKRTGRYCWTPLKDTYMRCTSQIGKNDDKCGVLEHQCAADAVARIVPHVRIPLNMLRCRLCCGVPDYCCQLAGGARIGAT